MCSKENRTVRKYRYTKAKHAGQDKVTSIVSKNVFIVTYRCYRECLLALAHQLPYTVLFTTLMLVVIACSAAIASSHQVSMNARTRTRSRGEETHA